MADDLKGLLSSPEFTSASQPERLKILGQHSAKFDALDEASKIKSLSTLESKYGVGAPQRQEAMQAGNQAVQGILGTGLSAGLPIAGMGLGQALSRGAGPVAQAGARMGGAMLGGATAGKLTGESGIPITGSPTADQAIMATIAQAIPELGAGLIGKGVSTAKAAAGARALTQYEDAAATKIAGKVQEAIPWWKGQYSKDHAGLVDMVYGSGPEKLQQGYADMLTKIEPYVQGQPILIDVRAAQRLGLDIKALARQPGAAAGAPEEVVVDMGKVVQKLPALREKDPSAYSYIVRNVDRYLADMTGLPSEFKDARKAYAEGRGFIDSMQKSGAIDPAERRLKADKLATGLIKKDVLNQQASRARAPVTRQTLQEVSPLDRPAPIRGELDIHIPGLSRRLGSETRGFERGPTMRIPTAKNVPGQTQTTSPAISRGIPWIGGGLSQIAREAMTRRRPDAE